MRRCGSVAVVGGASEALGQLAILTAQAGGEVLLVASDFPSVTYPWLVARERFGTVVRWVKDDPGQDLTAALVDGIQSCTTAVCFSAVQFATGSLVDVGEVVRRAHAVGARVIVDVTQMAGAMAVSLRSWSADALVCSGYKWLSTHGGVALLAVADELLQKRAADRRLERRPAPVPVRPHDTGARNRRATLRALNDRVQLGRRPERLDRAADGSRLPGARPTRRSAGARARGRDVRLTAGRRSEISTRPEPAITSSHCTIPRSPHRRSRRASLRSIRSLSAREGAASACPFMPTTTAPTSTRSSPPWTTPADSRIHRFDRTCLWFIRYAAPIPR